MPCLFANAITQATFDSLRHFRAFTLTHGIVLIGFILLACGIITLGRRVRGTFEPFAQIPESRDAWLQVARELGMHRVQFQWRKRLRHKERF